MVNTAVSLGTAIKKEDKIMKYLLLTEVDNDSPHKSLIGFGIGGVIKVQSLWDANPEQHGTSLLFSNPLEAHCAEVVETPAEISAMLNG